MNEWMDNYYVLKKHHFVSEGLNSLKNVFLLILFQNIYIFFYIFILFGLGGGGGRGAFSHKNI